MKASALRNLFITAFSVLILLPGVTGAQTPREEENTLSIGWACRDITPDKPVALRGQFYKRISKIVHDPLKVTALAFETIGKNGNKEQSIMVSVDLVGIEKNIQDELRQRIQPEIPDFNVKKLFLNATHTHSAPGPSLVSLYDLSKDKGLMTGPEFHDLLLTRLAEAVTAAWKDRKPGGISSVLGHAVVGHNRRIEYTDGRTVMYGPVDMEGFLGTEGPVDHGVEMLFCWDGDEKLTGVVINVACPSQVTEAQYYVSADFWSEVRKELRKRYTDDIFVLTQCGAAGDQSPRDLPRAYRGEPDMWGESGMAEIGQRIADAVERAYPRAKMNVKTKVAFTHMVKELDLPVRRVERGEYEEAVAAYNKLKAIEPDDENSPWSARTIFMNDIRLHEKLDGHPPYDNKELSFVIMRNKQAVIDRYNTQESTPSYRMELHVMRIGNAAFASNPFELFTDYGLRMKARSKAEQTFVIQLSGDTGGYLPTAKAVPGGGYSALVVNGKVGPEGGRILVDETVQLINSLWEE